MVLGICLLSFFAFRSSPTNFALLGSLVRLAPATATTAGYLLVAGLMVVACAVRMWAGSALSSRRMMAFRVQSDKLVTLGAYRLVRHPIYLADFIAFFGFALCLRPIGILMPVLLYAHYMMLTAYEERTLKAQFGSAYSSYAAAIPRFLPDLRSFSRLAASLREFEITADGFRHNALYLLFVPGFVVSAITGSVVPALLIGLPAVIDWAVIHTIKGVGRTAGNQNRDFSAKVGTSGSGTKVTSDVLYAQCWEDPEIDRAAFGIGPDDTVFTITSGGCNALAFLADDPREVLALDLSPFQNFVLDLKMAAFRELDHEDLLAFLGAAQSQGRLATYALIRRHLAEDSRRFWDAQPDKLAAGVIHCGRYERFMHHLQRGFRVMLGGRKLSELLLAAATADERARVFREHWDSRRLRLFMRVLLSRNVQSAFFDPAFFAQLGESFSFGEHFRERLRHAVIDLPLRSNPFFCYILFRGYPDSDALPTYLRAENHDLIRRRLDRVRMVTGNCETFFPTLPEGTISKFNFTNVFEWMTPASFEALLRETVRVARDGAVLTYRNLLVPRARPEALAGSLVPDPALAAILHEQDRSFIYRSYIVERVRKN